MKKLIVLAAVTFLERNPKDFDHPDLLRQLFLKSALQKAQDQRTREAATNLNIRWNKRTYVFEVIGSDTPVLALNLEDQAAVETVQPAPVQFSSLEYQRAPFGEVWN